MSQNHSVWNHLTQQFESNLGPDARKKLLVTDNGNTVSGSPHRIIDELDLSHPIAQLCGELVEDQNSVYGDGATSSILLTGALLRAGFDLVDEGIHRSTVAAGFARAVDRLESPLDDIARNVSNDDRDALDSVAKTAMTGIDETEYVDELADIVVKLFDTPILDAGSQTYIFDGLDVKRFYNTQSFEPELVMGVLLRGRAAIEGFDDSAHLSDVRVGLFDTEINPYGTARVHNYNHSPDTFDDHVQMVDKEKSMLESYISRLLDLDIDLVVTERSIENVFKELLRKNGIACVEKVSKKELRNLARAGDGAVVTEPSQLSDAEVSRCGRVTKMEIADETVIKCTEFPRPIATSVVFRGGDKKYVKETENLFKGALHAMRALHKDWRILPGGGATEMYAAGILKADANAIDGRESLAYSGFAEALKSIPLTLAENAGLDPLEITTTLRSHHANGMNTVGIDAASRGIGDAFEAGIVHPYEVQRSYISNAAEVARKILRVDDIIQTNDGLMVE